MDVTLIQQLIASLGFPIFVAIWFMVKSSKDMQALTNTLNELKEVISLLNAKIKE
jgi:hypothetical protein